MLARGFRSTARLSPAQHRSALASRPHILPHIRSLASMSDAKLTFMLYAPDYTDPDALSRRMAVRPKHLANADTLKGEGVLRTWCAHTI